MITKANKDIANRKYTYFFMATSTAPRKRKRLTACDSQVQSEVWISYYKLNCASKPSVRKIVGNFNCTSKAKASDSARFSISTKYKVRCGSRVICQPCDLRMIVVSTIPDNALLRKLRVLNPTKFWIFLPIDKNSVLNR